MKLSEYTKFKDVKSLINNLYAYSTEWFFIAISKTAL